MSDPASNVNIEDVLTSIRRLVSSTRDESRSEEPRRRFVLTEAHRVDADPQVPEGTEAAEPVLTLETTGDPEEPALVLRDPAPARPKGEVSSTAARMETALNSQDLEFEPDGSEVKADQPWHEVADVPFVHARGAASTAAVLAERAERDAADSREVAGPSASEAFEFTEPTEGEAPQGDDQPTPEAEEDTPSPVAVGAPPAEEETAAVFDSVRTPPDPQDIAGAETGLTVSFPGDKQTADDSAQAVARSGETADPEPEASTSDLSAGADAAEREEQGDDLDPLQSIEPLAPLAPLAPLPLNTDRAPQGLTAEGDRAEAEPHGAERATVSFAGPGAESPLADEAASETAAPEDDPWSAAPLEAAAEPRIDPEAVAAIDEAEKTRPPRFTDDTRLRRIVFEAEERAAEVFEPDAPDTASFVPEQREAEPFDPQENGELDRADTPITSDPGYELNGSAAGSTLPALALDEEELRELVAEIVRQELRGALGERITGNVRKLVRREIHRVLASYEFET